MPSKTGPKPSKARKSATADIDDYLLDGDLDGDNPLRSPSPRLDKDKRKEASGLGIDEEVEVQKRVRVPRVKLDEARFVPLLYAPFMGNPVLTAVQTPVRERHPKTPPTSETPQAQGQGARMVRRRAPAIVLPDLARRYVSQGQVPGCPGHGGKSRSQGDDAQVTDAVD